MRSDRLARADHLAPSRSNFSLSQESSVCNLRERLRRDAAEGKRTSEAARTFVGRCCPCPSCHSLRRAGGGR